MTRTFLTVLRYLPSIPLHCSAVVAVMLLVAVACIFSIYSLLEPRCPVFRSKREEFIPFRYIDRTTVGADAQPYIDSLRPFAALPLSVVSGPFCSIIFPHGGLILTIATGLVRMATNGNSTKSTSHDDASDNASTVRILLNLLRVWARVD